MNDDAESIAILKKGAKTFPDAMLVQMFIEQMDRAIAMNNSGAFKVATVLADELDNRGLSNPQLRQYNELVKFAVKEAEERNKPRGS